MNERVDYDPMRIPGWLRQLLEDETDVYKVSYAERNCSTGYYIDLLAQRRRDLEHGAAARVAYEVQA